jgi:molecular chaperone IbpA
VTSTNSPPYNIAKDGDTTILEFALAGYSKENISISVDKNNLIIRGEKTEDQYQYQHKGITTKRFERSFVLAEHAVIKNAEFTNGLLRIFIDIVIPEDKKPITVQIL